MICQAFIRLSYLVVCSHLSAAHFAILEHCFNITKLKIDI